MVQPDRAGGKSEKRRSEPPLPGEMISDGCRCFHRARLSASPARHWASFAGTLRFHTALASAPSRRQSFNCERLSFEREAEQSRSAGSARKLADGDSAAPVPLATEPRFSGERGGASGVDCLVRSRARFVKVAPLWQ
jgi:hypothetical protein